MSDNEINSMNIHDGVKVRIQLNSLDPTYKVPTDAIAVPSDVRKTGLSKVVNYLLGNVVDGSDTDYSDSDSDDEDNKKDKKNENMVDFDFLISNRFLRTSVSSYMRSHNISAESVLRVDFLPKANKPEEEGESEELPDWVSGLYFSSPTSTLFSGCYDGTVRCMNGSTLKAIHTVKAHNGAVKCIHGNGTGYLATGGHDQQLLVHEYGQKSIDTIYSCDGHTSSVECVAWKDNRLASGDFGGRLGLWNVDGGIREEASKKKQKTDKSKSKDKSLQILQPSFSTPLHSAAISGVAWSTDSTSLITSSHDYSIRLFDISSSSPALTLNSNRVVTCLSKSLTSDIVATGHPDTHIKLWDMRVKSGSSDDAVTTADNTLRPSHKSWISSIKFSPHSVYTLSTSSHDGTVKMWDVRCSLPLHTIKGHTGKVKGGERGKAMEVEYGKKGDIYSGGTDGEVKRFGGGVGE